MKLVFLDTRGKIEARTRRHRRHTSLLVEYYRRRIMARLRKWGRERGVAVTLAYDGLERVLR